MTATVALADLPNPGMAVEKGSTALGTTDPKRQPLIVTICGAPVLVRRWVHFKIL